jgi:hypothetical protein
MRAGALAVVVAQAAALETAAARDPRLLFTAIGTLAWCSVQTELDTDSLV